MWPAHVWHAHSCARKATSHRAAAARATNEHKRIEPSQSQAAQRTNDTSSPLDASTPRHPLTLPRSSCTSIKPDRPRRTCAQALSPASSNCSAHPARYSAFLPGPIRVERQAFRRRVLLQSPLGIRRRVPQTLQEESLPAPEKTDRDGSPAESLDGPA